MEMLVPSLNDKEIAILHACIEVDAVTIEVFLQIPYQDIGLLRLQTPTTVILQQIAFETDEVATQGQIVVGKFNAYACGFQRTTTLIDEMLVIAKNTAVGDLTAWMESVGNRLQHTTAPIACKEVEIWRVGILQEGLSAQFLNRPVGHTIGEDDEMLRRPTPTPDLPKKGGSRMVCFFDTIFH